MLCPWGTDSVRGGDSKWRNCNLSVTVHMFVQTERDKSSAICNQGPTLMQIERGLWDEGTSEWCGQRVTEVACRSCSPREKDMLDSCVFLHYYNCRVKPNKGLMAGRKSRYRQASWRKPTSGRSPSALGVASLLSHYHNVNVPIFKSNKFKPEHFYADYDLWHS